MRIIKQGLMLCLLISAVDVWAAKWSYSGMEGPQHWGSLEPDFSLCAKGVQQSPIDLANALPLRNNYLHLHYHPSLFSLCESPHNLYQDSVKPSKNYLAYNGQPYNLVEIHFHVPSEHRLNGKQYPMEVHLVHQNSKHELLVVGVFLKLGASNGYLASLLNAPQFQSLSKEIEPVVQLNPALLIPASFQANAKRYFTYQGSLTTPPCAEGVTWVMAQDPVELSAAELKLFKDQVNNFNSRGLQKRDERALGYQS